MARVTPAVPAGMRRVHRRFEHWRSRQKARLPIPKPLWAAAVKLAQDHGVFRTAQVLRLEYGKLKRLVERAGPVAPVTTPPPAFVELLAPLTAGLSECLVELEGPRGKMRIQWKGTTAPDLAGLSRALWESA